MIRLSTGRKKVRFWGEGLPQNRNKSRFSTSAKLLISLLTKYILLFCVWKWSDCVEVNGREGGTSCLSVKRDAPPRLPPTEGPFLKGSYLWRCGTHIHKTGHSVVEKHSSVRKRPIVAKKKTWKCVNRADYSKYVGAQLIRIRLKIAKKVFVVSEYI